jgi:carboxypeptidase Taq
MALSPYQQLQEEFAKAQALEAAAHYLRFDAETQMPYGVALDRGEQLAALELERHSILVTPKIARLIDRAWASVDQLDPLDVENLEHMRRMKERALAIPKSMLARRARASARALAARRALLNGEDEAPLWSHMAELLALTQDRAALLAKTFNESPEDCLLDEIHPGLRFADVEPLLKALSNQLPELVAEPSQVEPSALGEVSGEDQFNAMHLLLSRLPVPMDRIQIEPAAHNLVLSKVPGDYRFGLYLSAQDPWLGLRLLTGTLTDALHHHALPISLQRQPVSTERSRLLRCAERYFWGQRWSRETASWMGIVGHDGQPFWASQSEAQLQYALSHSGTTQASVWGSTELGFFAKAHVMCELDQRLFDGELQVHELETAYKEATHRLPAAMANDPHGVIRETLWVNGEWFRPIQWLVGAAMAIQIWELIKAEQEQLLDEARAGDTLAVWHWWREQFHSSSSLININQVLEKTTGRMLSAQPIFRHFDHSNGEGSV